MKKKEIHDNNGFNIYKFFDVGNIGEIIGLTRLLLTTAYGYILHPLPLPYTHYIYTAQRGGWMGDEVAAGIWMVVAVKDRRDNGW